MPQTRLAILALMMITVLSINEHRSTLQKQRYMVQYELATMATGVAVDFLEDIGTKFYDENVKGGTLLSASDLTPYDNFGVYDTPADDIDDFSGIAVDTFRVMRSDTLWFRVEAIVTYATEADPDQETATPTKYKKAMAVVYGRDGVLLDTLSVSQVFSCGSRCAW